MASAKKVGRNDPCACGSGRKYKNCCEGKSRRLGVTGWAAIVALVAAAGVVAILLLRMVQGDAAGPDSARNCPPGTAWMHGHCHPL